MDGSRRLMAALRAGVSTGATVCCLLSGSVALRADIVSDFEEGDEGWMVIELADTFGAGPYTKIVRGPVRPAHAPSNGNPGAALLSVDLQGNSFFFQAPPKFLGDVRGSYGLRLFYDLTSAQPPPGDWYVEADAILTSTNGTVLAAQIVTSRPASWATYSVPLYEGSWHHVSLNGGNPTREEFLAVLASLRSLWIRGEHFYGTDATYFDNVRLEQPAGQLRQATAIASIRDDKVVALRVLDGGFGFTETPSVIVTDFLGQGATALATVSGGIVTGIVVVDGGKGYAGSTMIRITIAPPLRPPVLSIQVTDVVRLTATVWPGVNYLIESSTDQVSWQPLTLFNPPGESYTWKSSPTADERQFYRVRQQ